MEVGGVTKIIIKVTYIITTIIFLIWNTKHETYLLLTTTSTTKG